MSVDLKAATPDTTIPATGAFLFGADSQSASAPSVYRIDTTILQYLDSLAHSALAFGASAGAPDVYLQRDAANILAQRNGTNAQTFRAYNTYTDASNYERGVFDWSTTANVLRIGAEAAGTGTLRAVRLLASQVDVTAGTGGFNVGGGTAGTTGRISVGDSSGNSYARLDAGLAGGAKGAILSADATFGFSGSNGNAFGAPDTTFARVSAGVASINGGLVAIGTAGIGYGTGAGGAVTQATSRTTGVTLNKIAGAITLVSAAGSTTPATFTVTNSAVAATDTIILSQKSGTDLYDLKVTSVASGSFNITFNTTGGTTSEQPVINFAVIKAVAA